MINPLNTLLRTPVTDGSHYRWGYVTSTSPTLQVVLDTETSPIQKPSTLVPLEVGDRVFVLLESLRATVLGKVPSSPVSPVWSTYSPVLFATGTNPTMGNSTVSGRYRVDGKTVHVSIYIVFGSSFSAGSGLYGVTLPVAPHTTQMQALQVAGVMGGDRNGQVKIEGSLGIIRIFMLDSGVLRALGTNPPANILPASGNRLIISGTYEAA